MDYALNVKCGIQNASSAQGGGVRPFVARKSAGCSRIASSSAPPGPQSLSQTRYSPHLTSLLLVPALMGIAGMLTNGWHSDKTGEGHWHPTILLVAAGMMFGLLILVRHEVPSAISRLLLAADSCMRTTPPFWAIPIMMLSESAAAATFGFINSIGQLGGFAGNYAIGFLNDRTHSLTVSFGFIALVYFSSATLILSLRIRNPLTALERSNQLENQA